MNQGMRHLQAPTGPAAGRRLPRTQAARHADGKARGCWTCLVSTAWARGGEGPAQECGWPAVGRECRAHRGLLLSYGHNGHSGSRVTDWPETFLGERRWGPGCPTPAPLAPRTPRPLAAWPLRAPDSQAWELGTQWEGGERGLLRLRLPQPPGRPPPPGLCLHKPGFLDGPSRFKHRALTELRAELRGPSRTQSSAPPIPSPEAWHPTWPGPTLPVATPGRAPDPQQPASESSVAAFVWDKTRGRVGSLPAPLPPFVERLLRSSGPPATSWRLGDGAGSPRPANGP